jgi:hypothetical protein
LQAPTLARPTQITRNDNGTLTFASVAANLGLGAHVRVELQNPGNGDAIYTVPANKTFTGTVIVIGTIPSGASLGVSAASGGSQASITSAGGTSRPESAVPVLIAGGGGGNALTATVSGSPTGVSVIIDGYVK